jgi:hypothetical protein
MSTANPIRRPTAVFVLALWHVLVGVVPLVVLLIWFATVPGFASCSTHQTGGCAAATGVVVLAPVFAAIIMAPIGFGLWKGVNTARIVTMALSAISLIAGIYISYESVLTVAYFGPLGMDNYELLYLVGGPTLLIVYGAGVIYVLTRKPVKTYFSKPI